MINLRYHIVSITAVFLAIGIGVALGSTFLDQATVDVLERNIRSAEERIRTTNAENERLRSTVDDAEARDEGLILLGPDRLLGEELTDQRVLVVAAPGVGADQLDPIRSVLGRSGADLRGTLRLDDDLHFDDDEPNADLAADLGLEDPTVSQLRDEVYDQLVQGLAAAGAPIADPEPGPDETTTTTTTTTPPAETVPSTTVADEPTTTTTTAPEPEATPEPERLEQPAVLTALLARGFAEVDPGPGFDDDDPLLAETGYRFVYVGAPDASDRDNDVLLRLLPGEDAGEPLPVVVVTSTQEPPGEDEEATPTIVTSVRDDDALAARYTTVDDVETFSGMAATVFSLADLGTVAPGHYGQADGASAVLPPLP
jgi:hypothetical protein